MLLGGREAVRVQSNSVYDSVRVKVAPGVTCPSGWTASTESITIPTLYIVQVPVSIGGRWLPMSRALRASFNLITAECG